MLTSSTRTKANACISNQGHLTPAFEYIGELMKKRTHAGDVDIHLPHILIELRGHLFDSGLINQVLDILEHHDCHFNFQECTVSRKVGGVPEKSNALLRVSANDVSILDNVKAKVRSLVDLIVAAEASVDCFDGAAESERAKKGKAKKMSGAVVESQEGQSVLVLGAGRVAASLSEYLGRSARRNVIVADQHESEARCVANQARRGTGVALDALADRAGLSRLVKNADVVVSLLPAPMHPTIAEECLSHQINLVTASYVSPEISALEERCQEAGVSIINEVGLDPGMDHMSAMKIIEDVQSRGGEIASFSSVCGGLPAPEAANNPLMYKFSWSPMGVLRACQNDAIYMREGGVVNVEGKDLLSSARPFNNAWPSLHLEVLPNRDSLVYADKYGIQSANSIFRGTLRYHGFSSLLHVFKNMGLLEQAPGRGTWGGVLKALQEKQRFRDQRSYLMSCSGGDKATANKAAACLKWLGITADSQISKPDSIVESFCDVLEEKLCFQEKERDMVLMHHDIHASFEDGSREVHRSSLQLYGDDTTSAMCKTVGYTAAVATDLLLSGHLKRKGILLPTSKDIYEPCLLALKKEGLTFVEEVVVETEEDLSFGA